VSVNQPTELLTFCGSQVPTELVLKAAEINGLEYVTIGALVRVAIAMAAGYGREEAVKRFAQSPTRGVKSLLDERDQADAGDQADAADLAAR
jgi:hypothetical protein